MMVAMVFVIPVPLMIVPPVLIMVIVRMVPVGTLIGRTIPAPRHPNITATVDAPIAIDPCKTRTRRRRPAFIAQWRRRTANDDANLCIRGGSDRGKRRGCKKCNRQLRLQYLGDVQGDLLNQNQFDAAQVLAAEVLHLFLQQRFHKFQYVAGYDLIAFRRGMGLVMLHHSRNTVDILQEKRQHWHVVLLCQ
jgi:hypothetical protein